MEKLKLDSALKPESKPILELDSDVKPILESKLEEEKIEEEDATSIRLQLGDIIKIDAPVNDDLHDKTYYIKFINAQKIELINEDKLITLEFSADGRFLEESIKNILLLHRQESPSYIVQNNIKFNNGISLYFGEPTPFVLNGVVTNIEEDMIEITILPSNKIIYIDFAYAGIPEHLNIEKIVMRDNDNQEESNKLEDANIDENLRKIQDGDLGQDDDDTDKPVFLDLENKMENDYDLVNHVNEEYDEIILENIELGEEMGEFYHYVNVPENKKRFGLDEQLSDYLDINFSKLKTQDLTSEVINNIKHEANRFKELRFQFSTFDSNNVPSITQENGEFHKPLKELLLNLNKKIYWLLPVSLNKRLLIGESEEMTEVENDENIIMNDMSRFTNNLKNIIDNWSKNTAKDSLNGYKKYITNLLNIYDSNISKYDNNLTDVNTQMHMINDMYDDFNTYVIKKTNLNKSRFVIDVYNSGFNMLESFYENNKKRHQFKELTPNNKALIIAFVTLPLPIFNFSKINHEYTSIYEKANLSNNFFNYSNLLNESSPVNKYILEDDAESYINTENTIHNNKLLQDINYFSTTNFQNETMLQSTIDADNYMTHYNMLLESFIPTITNLLKELADDSSTNTNMNTNMNFVNYDSLVNFLQVANIDMDNINASSKKYLDNIVSKHIKKYKEESKANSEILNKIIAENNNLLKTEVSLKGNLKYNFNLLNKELKQNLFENYDLDEEIINSDGELYNCMMKIDNCKFFITLLNKNIMDLLVSNLIENFIKQNKNMEKAEFAKIADAEAAEESCEKYYLSKKYASLEELEYDNNKLIFVDAIYDNTFYSITQDFVAEKAAKGQKEFFEFLTVKIMEKMNISKKNALREAKAIIDEKREVIDGDYCVLLNKEDNKNYIYIRKESVWEVDEKFKNDFYIDSNKILCNVNKDCISKDDTCINKDKYEDANLKSNVNKIMDNFEAKYNLSIEEIKTKMEKNYLASKKYLINIKKINTAFREKTNTLLLQFSETYDDSKILWSPREKLRDKIMEIPDFAKRQEYIKKFCLKFCREAISDENKYWLYCVDTRAKLIPSFLLKLANAFSCKRDYVMELDNICAEQGTISDDNNYWVDKYSGYIIKRIDFSSDEGYDDQGFKLLTKEIMEKEYAMNGVKIKSLNPNVEIIHAIVKSVSELIGVTTDLNNYIEFIVNNVLKIQNASIPSKEQYEKIVLKMAKKEGKAKMMPDYEDAYNSSLLLLTLTFMVVTLQISIPSIKTRKTFPGCIRSFKGYPFEGDQDKGAIIYIACTASKMRSSIKPWNTILKTNEASIAKKIETLIEKYVLINVDFKDLTIKKREYLLLNTNTEAIPDAISIAGWNTFYPPLMDIHISKENLLPMADTLKDDLIENITKGRKNTIYETLQSKIIYLSNAIIESIQKVCKKEAALLENNSGEPFLENACCNTMKNAINYFIKHDKSIIENTKLIKYYTELVESYNLLGKPAILYDPNNTKLLVYNAKTDFSEIIIYKAFIYYCNFNNEIPIDDELRSVCLDKPTNFNENLSIEETIELLKGEGKVYNKDSLMQLLQIINKRNLVAINMNTEQNRLNNIENARATIENYDNIHHDDVIDENFLDKFRSMLDADNYAIDNRKNAELRSMKNYLIQVNFVMKNNIIQNLKKIPALGKKDFENLQQFLNIPFKVGHLKFFKTYVINFLYVFPNIVSNKQVDYNAIPLHWKLSDVHRSDVFNIVKSYYNTLMALENSHETAVWFETCFEIIIKNCKVLIDFMNNIFYKKEITIGNSKTGEKISNVFDEKFLTEFYNYIFYTFINELLIITSNETFMMEIGNSSNYNKEKLEELNVNYLITFMNIMNNHYNLLNNNYKKVKEKISYAKEREKDLITDYLKELNDEEREIENIFKNNKLEKWNKGLQKGVTQYVKENYDEERATMEKQALKEKILNKNSYVTAMNKEIYEMDLEEKMRTDQEIEDEEYNMDNIPDDDDYESDNDYD